MAIAPKPMTLTQKIPCQHAVGLKRPWVETGETIRIKVDWTIASELAWNGMNSTYEKLGRPPIRRIRSDKRKSPPGCLRRPAKRVTRWLRIACGEPWPRRSSVPAAGTSST